MALALCLLFDPPGDQLVRRLWQRLEARGIPTLLTHTHRRHRPHLSLAVARTWELDTLMPRLEQLPTSGPTTLWFPGVVAFTRGRASLVAGVNADLARQQQTVAQAVMATGADLHCHYWPGRWVPHVSMTTGGNADHLPTISTAVNDALPIALTVASAALIDSSNGHLWPLTHLVQADHSAA